MMVDEYSEDRNSHSPNASDSGIIQARWIDGIARTVLGFLGYLYSLGFQCFSYYL